VSATVGRAKAAAGQLSVSRRHTISEAIPRRSRNPPAAPADSRASTRARRPGSLPERTPPIAIASGGHSHDPNGPGRVDGPHGLTRKANSSGRPASAGDRGGGRT